MRVLFIVVACLPHRVRSRMQHSRSALSKASTRRQLSLNEDYFTPDKWKWLRDKTPTEKSITSEQWINLIHHHRTLTRQFSSFTVNSRFQTMLYDTEYFVRELDISFDANKVHSLQLHQKSVGDVNCIVWDASIVLAKYLEVMHLLNPNFLFQSKVIELGSGVGCVGLTAALLGANVTLTDLPEALTIMEDNISFNKETINLSQGSATAKVLNWGEKTDISANDYHLILLSDCVYYKESVKSLVQTLMDLCGKNTTIFQCQEMRDSEKQKDVWNWYLHHIQEEFEVEEVPTIRQHPEFTCPEIKLLRLTRK